MRIGFFGTPKIAAYCMERLLLTHEVVFAVTSEDKPAGRHRKIYINPVKEMAIKRSIPVLQPNELLEKGFCNNIKSKGADIFVVVAYGKIIPEEIFMMPSLKAINLHPSLLPRYRGAAPIQWALMNGEGETGVTIQFVDRKLDAGDILKQTCIPINIDMTTEDLFNIILPIGVDLLKETLELLEQGMIIPTPQDEDKATYCGKIDRETAHINWEESSLVIHNLIRGLNPQPVAWSTFRGRNIKIWKTRLFNERLEVKIMPGYLKKHQKNILLVGTGDGCLEILQIQPETKKRMESVSFINGYNLREGDFFEY